MGDINKIFEIYFDKEQIKKIRNSKILIIGCGGLGSNIAHILLRTGFLNLTIIDFDSVELKNLNRQNFLPSDIGKPKVYVLKSNLLKINPKAKIKALNKKINENDLKKIIGKYEPDIVVEAVDKEETKMFIFETAVKMKKKLITASGIADFGDVENIKIIRKKDYTIIGDLKKSIKEFKPLAPKVCVVASMQADEVLRRVLKGEEYE
ncbi:MAG: sulfur carrier protein ThiS adenylyltransferase ThiF [Elusimicrobiales bacterium]